MPDVLIPGFECTRCKHIWMARNKESRPTVCPGCKSPYWDRPKKQNKGKGEKA